MGGGDRIAGEKSQAEHKIVSSRFLTSQTRQEGNIPRPATFRSAISRKEKKTKKQIRSAASNRRIAALQRILAERISGWRCLETAIPLIAVESAGALARRVSTRTPSWFAATRERERREGGRLARSLAHKSRVKRHHRFTTYRSPIRNLF